MKSVGGRDCKEDLEEVLQVLLRPLELLPPIFMGEDFAWQHMWCFHFIAQRKEQAGGKTATQAVQSVGSPLKRAAQTAASGRFLQEFWPKGMQRPQAAV